MLQDYATDDLRVFLAVLLGEHTIVGLRNRGLRHRDRIQHPVGVHIGPRSILRQWAASRACSSICRRRVGVSSGPAWARASPVVEDAALSENIRELGVLHLHTPSSRMSSNRAGLCAPYFYSPA